MDNSLSLGMLFLYILAHARIIIIGKVHSMNQMLRTSEGSKKSYSLSTGMSKGFHPAINKGQQREKQFGLGEIKSWSSSKTIA